MVLSTHCTRLQCLVGQLGDDVPVRISHASWTEGVMGTMCSTMASLVIVAKHLIQLFYLVLKLQESTVFGYMAQQAFCSMHDWIIALFSCRLNVLIPIQLHYCILLWSLVDIQCSHYAICWYIRPLFSVDFLCFLFTIFRSQWIHLGYCAAAMQIIYKVLSTWLFVDRVSDSCELMQHVCDYFLFLYNFLGNGMVSWETYDFWKEKYCAWWHAALFCHVQCNAQALPDQHHLMLDSSICECTLIWRIVSWFRLRMLRQDM